MYLAALAGRMGREALDGSWAPVQRVGACPDEVPPELYKIGGVACAALLAEIVEASFAGGIPDPWRAGRMTPVPKTTAGLTSFSAARGVLLVPVGGKVVGRS